MQKKDYFQIHSISIEEFLQGKRHNNLICTNHKIAKKLEKKCNIILRKVENVNIEHGLCMFEII